MSGLNPSPLFAGGVPGQASPPPGPQASPPPPTSLSHPTALSLSSFLDAGALRAVHAHNSQASHASQTSHGIPANGSHGGMGECPAAFDIGGDDMDDNASQAASLPPQ